MSTKANIIIRSESNHRRELILYQHSEGHPNHMNLYLSKELRDLYTEFNEHGDVDWFMIPSKVAGSMIARSVPIVTPDTKDIIKNLPSVFRARIESSMMLGFPTLVPDIARVPYSNYEYYITLKEDVETNFFGYDLEVHKMLNGRKVSDILSTSVNFLAPKPVKSEVKPPQYPAKEVKKADA